MVKCGHPSCITRASYGVDGSKITEFCPRHAKDGMVNVRKLRCRHEGCTKRARFSVSAYGSVNKAEFCAEHARAGMIDAGSKTCRYDSCSKWPSFGKDGSKVTEFCAQHAEAGMVDVRRKRCVEQGCRKQPSYGVRGSRKAEYCAFHGKDGMVNVCSKRCDHGECSKHPKFGVNGSTKAEFCSKHAKAGMVNVRKRGCMSSTNAITSTCIVQGRSAAVATSIIRYRTKLPTTAKEPKTNGVGGRGGRRSGSGSGGSTRGVRAANTALAVETMTNVVGRERARNGGPERNSGGVRDGTERRCGGGGAAAGGSGGGGGGAVVGELTMKRVRNFDALISREDSAAKTNAAEPFMGFRKNRRKLGGGGGGDGDGYDGFAAKHPPAARLSRTGCDKVSKEARVS